ncbi:MAG: hypothetical protein V4733_11020 [Verrucomicrobiota bacterium]
MKRRFVPYLAIVCLLTSAVFAAEEVGTAKDKLIAALQAEDAKAREISGNSSDSRYRNALRQIDHAIARPGENAANNLDSILSSYRGDNVEKAVNALAVAIEENKEREHKRKIEEGNDLIKKAGTIIRAAKKPADLDDIIGEMKKAANRFQSGSYHDEERELSQTISNAHQQLIYWQMYLHARAKGETTAMKSAVQNMLSNYGDQFFKRSELLEKMDGEKQNPSRNFDDEITAVFAEIMTVPDVAAGIAKLRPLRKEIFDRDKHSYDNDLRNRIGNTLEWLQKLDSEYQAALAGSFFSIQLTQAHYADGFPGEEALKSRLEADYIRRLLPRYLELPEGSEPKDGEPIRNCFHRWIKEALARNDFQAAQRILGAKAELGSRTRDLIVTKKALDACIAAKDREAADQIPLAVVSYQTALASGGEFVPIEWIAKELKRIATQKPSEYEEGMNLYKTREPMLRGDSAK